LAQLRADIYLCIRREQIKFILGVTGVPPAFSVKLGRLSELS